MSLRQDLGQLAELRSEMGRLRVELTEQLSSEMLVERITMRTQASRLTAEPGRLDGPARALEGAWAGRPPRELTGAGRRSGSTSRARRSSSTRSGSSGPACGLRSRAP